MQKKRFFFVWICHIGNILKKRQEAKKMKKTNKANFKKIVGGVLAAVMAAAQRRPRQNLSHPIRFEER